jgi:CBS domain containing-hemolysin-like protein
MNGIDVVLRLALAIAVTLAVVVLNGVFVAAEFAIVRVRRTRLEELAGEGTQIGITVASPGVGWFGGSAFARLFIMPAPGDRVPGVVSTRTLQYLGHGEGPRTPLTEEELKLILTDSHEEGVLTEGEARIVIRAFEFADTDAEEILIGPEHVDFISLSRTFEENVAALRRHMHARLPLCRGGLDSIVGVVGMKDAWPLLLHEKSNAAFEQAARPAIKIPVDLPQDRILRRLQVDDLRKEEDQR